MANDQPIIITGKLTADPENRFTPSGASVTNFTIAFNPRRFDKQSNEWVDSEAIFWRCQAWNQGKLTRAENVANLLKKGDSVVAIGSLTNRKWQDKEGQDRTSMEVNIQSIGKDLTFHGQPYDKGDASPATQGAWGGQQQDTSGWSNGPTNPPF